MYVQGDNDPDAICGWGATTIKYIDPTTNIPYAANQINQDKKGCNPTNFYLPDFGYYYTMDELSFEVIFLEESATECPDDMGGQTYESCNKSRSIGCEYLGKMANASENMLIERAQESRNRNFLIIQHYPKNSNRLLSLFKDNRVTKSAKSGDSSDIVWSAFGHDHKQKCQHYSDKEETTCDSILTGGGSGCCGERTLRGFFVIDFDSNGQMTQPYNIDNETISCQYPCGTRHKWTQQQIEQSHLEHCCYAYHGSGNNENCNTIDWPQC